jgi:hypothetical protein
MAYYGLFALFPLFCCWPPSWASRCATTPRCASSRSTRRPGTSRSSRRTLRSQVHPLEGNNTVALVIGIVGTIYGSLGVGFAAQNAMNTVWNIPYVHWPSIWTRYARTLGVIDLLGVASVASTVLAAFATRRRARPEPDRYGAGRDRLRPGEPRVVPARLHGAHHGAAAAPQGRARGGDRHGPLGGPYRLWPHSVTQPPLTHADRLVFRRLAQMEVRRPEEQGQRVLYRCSRRGSAGQRRMTAGC